MTCPTAPRRLWLQTDPEPEEAGQPAWPADHFEVCWCQDKINDTDTLYVRADLAFLPCVEPADIGMVCLGAPKSIWMHWEAQQQADGTINWPQGDEAFWYLKQVGDLDVRYVRADLAAGRSIDALESQEVAHG